MTLLVTGANSLVGSHFIENYHPGNDITLSPAIDELDITDQKSVDSFFKLHQPDTVIHFAAFTDVSLAEKQRNNKKAPCWIVNVEGTANLVQTADPKTYFIYISTDVVFSGSSKNREPYAESDSPEKNPNLLSWYGWTKREAEKIVTSKLQNSTVLRISNPVRARYRQKLDYVRKILRNYDEGKLYPMFDDQYLTLTYINEVTDSLRVLLEKRLSGVFHVSSTNVFTPFKLASLLIEEARGKKGIVKSVSIKRFLKDNPARYPQYGGLKVEKTQQALNLRFMRWEETVEVIVKQLSVLAEQE